MGCLLVLLAAFAPRVTLLFVWIFSDLVDRAFAGFVIEFIWFIPPARPSRDKPQKRESFVITIYFIGQLGSLVLDESWTAFDRHRGFLFFAIRSRCHQRASGVELRL